MADQDSSDRQARVVDVHPPLAAHSQASELFQPTDRAFDDPAFGHHDELAEVRPLDDLDEPSVDQLGLLDERPGVSAGGRPGSLPSNLPLRRRRETSPIISAVATA
jgi:hypothetical protein